MIDKNQFLTLVLFNKSLKSLYETIPFRSALLFIDTWQVYILFDYSSITLATFYVFDCSSITLATFYVFEYSFYSLVAAWS